MNLPPTLNTDTTKPDEVCIDIVVSDNLEAFRGHFPAHPILPGVVQIDWALRFAALHLGIGQATARDFQVKFRSIIHPDCPLSLRLQLDRSKNRLSFAYMSDEAVMSSGHIKLGDAA